ncbi:dihydrodipicolinate reductase C-terminal domain-containing protein [Dyadobacter fanqingshengii]|uniref:Dihydrodipicolinate reductase C-terminal domain-containing protein n=1 Tax=Dyadobacter fanqingshengii TaxID=2906443 RepID=A0A9X1PAU7_9BACT|nr:dihydrodipicolinate reductase C-terminal domain-containing protein [Dyadobacter fanqingshengii]MCF0040513.1 hypothetical protein [Dyadobacter fanqingshengii]USJ37746.1 hypothetical protein NFI81_08160 [Dyadobacter fanqingshengii]
MKVFVVGSGKLASAMLSAKATFQNCDLIPWESAFQHASEQAIILHCGSGRQIAECIMFCEQTASTFIELSTGLETEHLTPDFPLVICPNTSMLMLKTMAMLGQFGKQFKDYNITLTESHQAAKQTEPGTAYNLANSLGFPVEQIISVRDQETQSAEIAIPDDFLGKHAYHKIVIQDGNDALTIETKVLGHASYAAGVRQIIDLVLNKNLENRRYNILEFMQ